MRGPVREYGTAQRGGDRVLGRGAGETEHVLEGHALLPEPRKGRRDLETGEGRDATADADGGVADHEQHRPLERVLEHAVLGHQLPAGQLAVCVRPEGGWIEHGSKMRGGWGAWVGAAVRTARVIHV